MRTTLVLIALASAAFAAPQPGPGPVEAVCCVECYVLNARAPAPSTSADPIEPPTECCCRAVTQAGCATKCPYDALLARREAREV
ncbi:hypothetical protein PsYK624_092000 [Phanerochaete sordida]|uniref:4Fe-4S ferredoxin-type domain-containing protein n=1 Tax=Phanerochaete sordida TaxID=48140 RepID=A0A9P3LEZ4_9APHY|nr:hypothetical protein PsYK624_092000 [Phanerochaete sordida]